MKQKLIQVDFHPDGRVVYIYDGDTKADVKQVSTRGMTSQEALLKRLEEYKKNKKGR